MTTERKNTILAGITGAVFLLAFLVNDPFLLFESSYEKSKPLISSKADRVKRVTVQDGANKRIFTRTTEGWSLEIPGNAMGVQRADTGKVETGLKNLFEARRYQEVSSNKEKQGEYEVRDQDYQILLEGENGAKIAHLVLGKFSGSGNASFVRLGDETSVFAVKGFLRGDWNQDVDQYRDRAILRIAKENIKEIFVTGKNTFTLRADAKGILTLDPARATDKNRIATYTADLTDLNGVRFYKDAQMPPAYGKIKVVLNGNIAREIEFFGPTKDQEFVARGSDAAAPLTVPKSKVEALFPRADDLADKGGMPQLVPNK
ncbi:MAG: DUF4340 domain-containing protein [Leptospiraceae bacterium]|nr:DUF4340 domain-containing protein [Leptospiraceae bacterium]